MYALSSTSSVARGAPARAWGRRAVEAIALTAVRLAREVRLRRDLRLLSGLDEAMLRDIGLARGGLERAVRYGRPSSRS